MNNESNKRFTLPKNVIIKKSQEFRDIFSSGIFFKSPNFTLVARPSTCTRIGFTVQRRIKPAVKRNRIKRRCRELWRLCWHRLSISADIVLVGKDSVPDTPFDVLKLEFIRLLKRLNSNKSFQ
jgi:ribonuclease P protein component